MSIIFGVYSIVGESIAEDELRRLAAATERYAPDGTRLESRGQLGMGIQHYYTHSRSMLESSPCTDSRGNRAILDGRLDNHAELATELGIDQLHVSDSSIMLAAFNRWELDCFSHFTGEWSIAIWSAIDRTIHLARDHAGTRTLYFHVAAGKIRWSTYIDTFFAHDERYSLDSEYVASFLCARRISELTPYRQIRAVAPAQSVSFDSSGALRFRSWNWLPSTRLQIQGDEEYEKRLLQLLGQSVHRRSQPGDPVLAELSGGIDSTTIVCLSDRLRRSSGTRDVDVLDTISYWDATEPNWDERPYFQVTESRRGKSGIHIETPTGACSYRPIESMQRPLWPEIDESTLAFEDTLEGAISGRGYRAILSGLGGDELLGGVPTPFPELADYLVDGEFKRLFRKSMEWCMASNTPLVHLLWNTACFTATLYGVQGTDRTAIPTWIPTHRRGYLVIPDRGTRQFEHPNMTRPSQIAFQKTWETILETLPHRLPGTRNRREIRYPYLDLDLVRFLVQVPREQVLRPGRRRSLMRRALNGIVPSEILERPRKASISRGPLLSLEREERALHKLFATSILAELGWIEPDTLLEAIRSSIAGNPPETFFAMHRALLLESWLQSQAKNPSHAWLEL